MRDNCFTHFTLFIMSTEILDRPLTHTDNSTDTSSKMEAPRKFINVLHNDDFTTMEFVMLVLQSIFGHTEEKAATLMLDVHHKGKAVVGEYIRDIAETKAIQVVEYAKASDYPLLCTVEPLN